MLLAVVLADIEFMTKVLHIFVIAWCSDAGGDSASMRRKLKELIPAMIVLDCWAHQVSSSFVSMIDLENLKHGLDQSRSCGLLQT